MCVFWIWFQVGETGELVVPKPVMRIVCPETDGGLIRSKATEPCASYGDRPVFELLKQPK